MADLSKKIDQLGEILDRHGLTAISIREGEVEIEVRREHPISLSQGSVVGPAPPFDSAAQPSGIAVLSPLTGIFYRRPSPDEPEYAHEGDRIEKGQTVGLIEAMKVFNPVESTASGVIKKFVVEDGKVVQEGDPILYVGE